MRRLTLTTQDVPRAVALVALTALVALCLTVYLTTLTLQAAPPAPDASPADMEHLYAEWEACMASETRVSECRLEYDGDGSSNTPADWHWYWREQYSQVLDPKAVTLLWEKRYD